MQKKDNQAQTANILVVDDSSSARSMIAKVLKKEGYTISEAENGKEAVLKYRRELPDIILMDANMPVVDGYKACSEIVRHPKSKNSRIIMVTAQGDDQSVDKAFSSGAEEYITKPIHWAVLLRRISLAVENLRAMQEVREGRTRLEVILNTAADAIVVINQKGIIESVNNAAKRIFGYAEREVIGKNVSMLMPSPYAERHNGYLAAYLETGKSKVLGQTTENIAVTKNGQTFPVELSVSEVKLEDRTLFTGIIRDITERKLAEEKIFYQANYDALTALPNRSMFMRTLEEAFAKAKKHNSGFGLMFVDLDRFKWVNDNLGHAAGDVMLQVSAERIKSKVGSDDMVARLGGDEFVVLIRENAEVEPVAAMAKNVLEQMNEQFVLEGKEVYISGSLGIALYPADAGNADDVLKYADEAMYRSKNAGRNAFHFYDGPSLVLEKKY